jgi:Uma2 family endonuclease
MVASRSATTFTEPEYLALEAVAEVRHEFVGGQILAMAGAELDHNQICENMRAAFRDAFAKRPCRIIGADQRVKVEATSEYFYPDVVVLGGEPKLVDPNPRSLINPEIIVEVLSPSTERYDRGEKWLAYQLIPTLTDCILIASDRRRVEQFQRGAGDSWTQRALSPTSALVLSDNTSVDLADLYRLTSVK